MNNPLRYTVVLGLAAAGLTLAVSDARAQSNSEAAAVREAIRFERTKNAADRRQLRTKASQPNRATETNPQEADRWTADRLTTANQTTGKGEPRQSDAAAVAEAVRFERSKDAAAARQVRLDARQSGAASTAVAKSRKAGKQ